MSSRCVIVAVLAAALLSAGLAVAAQQAEAPTPGMQGMGGGMSMEHGGMGSDGMAPRGTKGGDMLVVGDAGHALVKADAHALSLSADGGRNWTPIASPPQSAGGGIESVAVTAGDRGILYVAVRGAGVLRSDDGGNSWVTRNEGLPGTEVGALAAHADRSDTLYAYVTGHGIFRTEDGGLRWQLMDAGPREMIVHLVHSNMPGSMQTGWLFAATAKGVRRAMDCFCGWRDAGELARRVHAVAYDPRQPQRVYAAAEDGLFVSPDGGEQWQRISTPAADVKTLVVTAGGALYVATSDGVVYRSVDQARTWKHTDA